MSFSSVISESPSMFMASRLTKSVKDLICFAAQSGFGQIRTCVPVPASSPSSEEEASPWIRVGAPQTGQRPGISSEPDRVRFSAICGMIMFAL